MKPADTNPDRTTYLAVAFSLGAPGGAVLIVLSWWVLTMIIDPAAAVAWWEYGLVAAYLVSLVWAPLLAGFATLRLVERLGWADWRSL